MVLLTKITTPIFDNGGRRLGLEMRQFTYFAYIPERRSGEDRRRIPDRRQGTANKLDIEKERRRIFKKNKCGYPLNPSEKYSEIGLRSN